MKVDKKKDTVVITLGTDSEESYIARSTAKALLSNFKEFKHIVLDFKRVSPS